MIDTRTAVPVVVHYAVWYGPRWNDIYDCPVETRDPESYVMDPSADYFRLYDRLELDWEVGGETVKLRSVQLNFSPFYVPGGRLLTDEEREAAFGRGGDFQNYAGPFDRYTLIHTRFRRAVLMTEAEIVFLPPAAQEA